MAILKKINKTIRHQDRLNQDHRFENKNWTSKFEQRRGRGAGLFGPSTLVTTTRGGMYWVKNAERAACGRDGQHKHGGTSHAHRHNKL